ncbi:hypothetical protein Tco_1332581 [Tanacetum coccineum]
MRIPLMKDPHVWVRGNSTKMGLIDFITTSDMFKVKVGERTLIDEEFSLPKEIEDRVIPPSDEIIIVVYHTIVDELRDATAGKGGSKKIVAFGDSESAV